jgi:hypothetical protein
MLKIQIMKLLNIHFTPYPVTFSPLDQNILIIIIQLANIIKLCSSVMARGQV